MRLGLTSHSLLFMATPGASKLKRRPQSAMTASEMDRLVDRLSRPKERPRSPGLYHKVDQVVGGGKKRRSSDVQEIVERLATTNAGKVPDSKRTGANEKSGIMNSYAWTGW